MTEQQLLERGRDGDERAYTELVAPYRRELHAHCYRMLGSVHDADDALQEALLRAWRGLAGFEGRSSFRSWLYRITTNACLKLMERRPRLVLPIDYGPATDPHDGVRAPVTEPVWLGPYPDEQVERRETIELAFVAALQHLPARQRAVLILRDVLGFSGDEVAAQLETTRASVSSALQRAHKAVDERLPERSQQEALQALGDGRVRDLVAEYIRAWERGDVDAVVSLLTEDAIISMPPIPTWYAGRDAIGRFLRTRPLNGARRWRQVPVSANGQAAVASYLWSDQALGFLAHEITVLDIDGDRISGIMAFLDSSLVERWGLPGRLPPALGVR
jgi:RNA polymerase sigma-70 factor (ECF subfamily)